MINNLKTRVTETMKNVVFVLGVVASDLLAALDVEYRREKNRREWKEIVEECDEKYSSKRLYEMEESELELIIEELRITSRNNGWS